MRCSGGNLKEPTPLAPAFKAKAHLSLKAPTGFNFSLSLKKRERPKGTTIEEKGVGGLPLPLAG